jgi:hypothetical protein
VAKVDGGDRRSPLLIGGVLLIALAAALITAYQVIGSQVDPQGRLHEPFALIPLAWLSGVAGAVLVLSAGWRAFRAKRRKL